MSIDGLPHFTPQEPSPPLQLLSEDGALRPGAQPPLSVDDVVDALRLMLVSRTFDEKALSLQRQGRFGTFSQVIGQEASVVGSAMALDPRRDWVVPQYRELPALLRQGYPLEQFIAYFTGNPAGGWIPPGVNMLPIQISLAAQLPQAVGLAWSLRHQRTDGVVAAYFGDGASSEGDFHEAANLAGVLGAPVVFVLSDNGWAISTPRARQTRATRFAARAPGYGFPGVVVDGNDLFAVYSAMDWAVQRARAGEGPTLIESITYRVVAHNTADDPTRYQSPDEVAAWRQRDPIERLERYLTQQGEYGPDRAAALRSEARDAVDAAFARAAQVGAPSPDQVFEHVFAAPSARLERQRALAEEMHAT